jgi:hypothetical protein
LFVCFYFLVLKCFINQKDTKPKRVTKRSHQYYGGDDFGRGYDPFRLVPTSHYHDELPAPFEVEIISDALVSKILKRTKTV